MATPLVTIVGNRPQFVKLAPLSKEFKKRNLSEYIVHTGQHYDHNLSQVFFDEMDIPKPDVSLKVTGKSHGKMTAEMIEQLENLFLEIEPRGVLVFGDTNSTLAAALAAVKLKIPLAHVESGPRIHDIHTPEEINRIITDRSSQLLFCPDLISVQNLAREGMTQGVYFTGDVMHDAYLLFSERSKQKSTIIKDLDLNAKDYLLLTIHRPNNTDTESALVNLVYLLRHMKETVVFPVHPRTEAALKKYFLWDKLIALPNVKCIAPVGYLDMLALLNSSKRVMTDSGGLSREAYFAGKPALLLFYTTPWPQLRDNGWQKVLGTLDQIDIEKLTQDTLHFTPPATRANFFGAGDASAQIIDLLQQHHWF